MDKIKILKTEHCDSRTIKSPFTKAEVFSDTIKHVCAVYDVAQALAYTFVDRCSAHDWTKMDKRHFDNFYECMKHSVETGEDFTKSTWYKDHITLERHHPASHCVEDINLLDILEMCIDVTVAGLARAGKVTVPELSPGVLETAMKNTINLIASSIEVVEGEEEETKLIDRLTLGKESNDSIIDIKGNN